MSANNLNKNSRISKVASGDLWLLGLNLENRKLAIKWGCRSREQFDAEEAKRKKPAEQKQDDKKGQKKS